MFKYENLVVGGSFDAVYLAFKEGYSIVYKELEKPFEQDLDDGRNKRDIFDLMVFLLTLANLNPFSSKVADIRFDESNSNKITVSGHKPWIFEVEADKVHNFLDITHKKFKVVDMLRLRYAGTFVVPEIKTKNKFVNQVSIIHGKRQKKFAQVISFLTQKQLNDEDFSYIYSMLEAKKLLKESGLKGKKKGVENRPPQKRQIFHTRSKTQMF